MQLRMNNELSNFEKLMLASLVGECEKISQIASTGCPINQLDEAGFTPLIWAIMDYQVDAVRLLLELGADPNFHDAERAGFTPLDNAIQLEANNRKKERIEIVRLLMEYGADPTIRTWMQLNAIDRLEDARVLIEIKAIVIHDK